MKKIERCEWVSLQVERMAKTGLYENCYDIEWAFRQCGHTESRPMLGFDFIRSQIDAMCKVGQLARTRGISYDEAASLKR